MKQATSDTGDWERRQVINTKKLALWTTAWLLTMALASFGPALLWAENKAWSAFAIALSTLVGAIMIFANKRHLQSLDELQQRIQLEAMGVTLGVGLVLGLSYSNLAISNLIPGDAEISVLVILMGLCYLLSVVVGAWKHR
jgi:hypothetical protein